MAQVAGARGGCGSPNCETDGREAKLAKVQSWKRGSRNCLTVEAEPWIVFCLALRKELAENSEEATKVRTARTETSHQRQAPTHPALLANGIGTRQASSQTTLHTKWTTSSSIFAAKQRRPNPSTVEVLLGTWTPRELSQNLQTPRSIGLRLPDPQPPGGIVRRPRARDTSFPYPSNRALSTAPSV